jgi:glycosyltransferase involved in cell wall biosynthesis
MNILFVHNHFPAQYLHLAPAMAARGHKVVALSLHAAPPLAGVTVVRYQIGRTGTPTVHPLAGEFESKVIRGEAAAGAALALKKQGFTPDVICAHPGWGEAMFLKDVWPSAGLHCYFEFFYQANGADVNFDPEFSAAGFAGDALLRVKNANNLLALDAADSGVTPTNWQHRLFPGWTRPLLSVVHDGIDTNAAIPDAQARLRIDALKLDLAAGDETITFVNRNLEPYRGFHSFMRALPELQRLRPNARVLIIGGDKISYGRPPADGRTWKQALLEEVGGRINHDRVHFLGQVPYHVYLRLLQLSTVHVYLTYPFVVSWSLLEALSAGCVVIGSRTPPAEEVIEDGKNGLLVDFFDSQVMAERISAALENRQALGNMRAQARERIVADYDLRTVCLPRQIDLIERLR